MDTLTKSCSPTIVITANGEVHTHEEAIVFLAMPFFLAWMLLICRDNTVKVTWPLTGGRRNKARESTPCMTHPCSPSMT